MDILLTTYFSSRENPQRPGKHVNKNDFNYIKNYYRSVVKLNLDCVIFHDGLENEFIEKYETDKIRFELVDLSIYENKSLNDVRFLIYYDYLRSRNDINAVFMTDVNDVVVKKSPFPLIVRDDIIYIGSDRDRKLSHYFMKEIAVRGYGSFDKFFEIQDCKVVNAGVIGGEYNCILDFLGLLSIEFKVTNKEANANMMVVNYVIHTYYADNHVSGYPVTSKFMAYEKRNDVAFIHK